MTEQLETNQPNQEPASKEQASTSENQPVATAGKKKMSLAEFKVKSFVTQVKVDQMQFLKTAGG